jgi:hypothetical protein
LDPPSLLEVFCLYGYSLFIYIPLSLLFVALGSALRWVLIVFAVLLSG